MGDKKTEYENVHFTTKILGQSVNKLNNISERTYVKPLCVIKKGSRDYYPSNIPRARDSMTNTYIICIISVTFIHFVLSNNKTSLLCTYLFSIFFYLILNIIYRIILFLHELKHLHSRYDSYKDLIVASFSCNINSMVCFGACVLIIVYYVTSQGLPVLDDKYLIPCVLFFLHKLLDLDSNSINDSLCIAKENGLDYGSGMAYSFFFGYLNYILPKTGDKMKNLEEMMKDYESLNNVQFECHKIFILIPKSLTCHVEINAVSSLMELRSSLEDKVKTVAGVRDRVYRNSVYTIQHERTGKLIYVCAEYATPLKTFKEVCEKSTPHTNYYTRHKNDILLQFYLTLSKILEFTEMDKKCELVYYDDKDDNNQYYDVGRILLGKIVELKKKQNDSKNK
ncbi:stimulator of interferon genes protein [Sitophilus oryzae]|uniref:Stimulator of interferon genes protein n=1 Tax=Sitophilus oryzae TaxID=7048 RepID=A0A6J2XUQ3_SITOR|nr:stimulator of interferon genes protein [Sitophilus oryzae]